jgi:hypothetical protein
MGVWGYEGMKAMKLISLAFSLMLVAGFQLSTCKEHNNEVK